MFNILKFRKDKSLTQQDLGKIIGQKQAYVSQIESGTRPFLQEYLEKLKEKYEDINSYIEEDALMEPESKYTKLLKEKDEHIQALEKLVETQQKLIDILEKRKTRPKSQRKK